MWLVPVLSKQRGYHLLPQKASLPAISHPMVGWHRRLMGGAALITREDVTGRVMEVLKGFDKVDKTKVGSPSWNVWVGFRPTNRYATLLCPPPCHALLLVITRVQVHL